MFGEKKPTPVSYHLCEFIISFQSDYAEWINTETCFVAH